MRPGQRLYFFLFFFIMIVFLINLNRFMSSREYRKDYYYKLIDSLPKSKGGIDIRKMNVFLGIQNSNKRAGHINYLVNSEISFSINHDSVKQAIFYLADSWTIDEFSHPDLELAAHKYYYTLTPTTIRDEYVIKLSYHGRPSLYHEWIKGFSAELTLFDLIPEKKLRFANFFPPYGAQTLLFGNDFLSDKIDTFSVTFEVPSGVIPISAGKLKSRRTTGNLNQLTYTMHYPVAPYLVALYGAPYRTFQMKYSGTAYDFPVKLYFYPNQRQVDTLAIAERVKTILRFFEKEVGPYPFPEDELKLVEYPFGGGMETQACIGLQRISLENEFLIAHEMAHQYFGNKITPKFEHVWLSEGFATYLTALYIKYAVGKKEFWEFMNTRKELSRQSLLVKEIENPDSLYNQNLVYNKGAWILFMIHTIMGEKHFKQLLEHWANRDSLHYVTTNDLEKTLQKIYPFKWDLFFKIYVREGLIPEFEYDHQKSQARISNTRGNSHYPIPVILNSTRGPQVLWVAGPNQTIEMDKEVNPNSYFKYNPGIVRIENW